LSDETTISADDLKLYQKTYDKLIASLVRNISVTRARSRYTSGEVVLNAHAPTRVDVRGRGTTSGVE